MLWKLAEEDVCTFHESKPTTQKDPNKCSKIYGVKSNKPKLLSMVSATGRHGMLQHYGWKNATLRWKYIQLS